MSAERLRKPGILIIAAALIAAGAAAALLALQSVRRERQREEALVSLLQEADTALESGQYERAGASLSRALELADDTGSRLRIMKRAYMFRRSGDDAAQLAVWADRARRSEPSSPELTRLAVYAALRAGQSDRAQEILAERRTRRLVRSDPDLQFLAAEAALRSRNGGGDLPLPPELKALISLEDGDHPSFLIEQGRLSGDERYFLDAALLYMRRGQAKTARTILATYLENSYHEPAAYISYDAGATGEAARRAGLLIRSRPDSGDYRRFYGDLLFLEQRYDEAQAMYIRALQPEQSAGWQIFLSLAAALERGGDMDSARFYSARAYQDYPEVKEVLVRYAGVLARTGQQARAAEIVRGRLADYPGDPDMLLLFLRLSGSAAARGNYSAELWKLFNRFPEHPGLARALIEYLLGCADLRSAALAMNQHEAAAGPAPWLLEARALHAALSGDNTRAESLLREKIEAEDSWESRYNLAVVLGAGSRHSEGIAELMTAESLVPRADSGFSADRSKIRSRLGEFYAALGDTASARRELGYAVELDPANFPARLILKKLDEVSKK